MSDNSALWWLPRLAQTGDDMIPMTLTMPFEYGTLLPVLDGQEPETWLWTVRGLQLLASQIGYPVFVRSDLASAKHDGPGSYRMDRPEDAERVLTRIVEDSALKDLLPWGLLVREWLKLDADFTAFNGHPIAREFRVFTDGVTHECIHPYWPADAIWRPDREDWRDILEDQSQLRVTERQNLLVRAGVAARAMAEGSWSVDFAFGSGRYQGGWWLIDMAVGEESWHPDHVDPGLARRAETS